MTWRLSPDEALMYIEFKFKKISLSNYKLRRSIINSDKHEQIWLNYWTRIGFVAHHRKQLDIMQKIQDDSIQRLYLETLRPTTAPRDNPGAALRDEDLILKLKQDIRDNVKLLSELGMGTPVISAIKAKLDKVEVKDAKLGTSSNQIISR